MIELIFFKNEYMLNICPGSRAGGQEKRIIEVFWGSRMYDFESQSTWKKSFNETGVTLFFYRNDTGHITISLSPAKTEFIKPIEDSIVLYRWIDPKKLNNDRFIKSLWNNFIAYMQYTSLDGKPTYYQKLRVFYLRYFKRLVIDNKSKPTKFSKSFGKLSSWVLTVGLSGTIIYFLTIATQPKTNKTEKYLNEVNRNLKNISKKLDNSSKNSTSIKKISVTLDSIKTKVEGMVETNKNK